MANDLMEVDHSDEPMDDDGHEVKDNKSSKRADGDHEVKRKKKKKDKKHRHKEKVSVVNLKLISDYSIDAYLIFRTVRNTTKSRMLSSRMTK
jgi:hypothetical protein